VQLVPIDLTRSFEQERRRILRERDVDLLLDGGANEGQYARTLRATGFRGRIVSFEPLASAYARLAGRSASDPAWDCVQVALGDVEGRAEIHVAENSVSSSLRAPGEVRVARLDSFASELIQPGTVSYLKLDVQGVELEALRGAQATLQHTVAVECELSLVPLYEGQALFPEVVAWLDRAGFDLVALERAFTEPCSGKLLQLDGLFARRDSPGPSGPALH
jgi:FkbM family methyltransferase